MINNFSFEKLEVYKQSLALVKIIYDIVEKFPSHEKYALYSQIHRAIVSVPSNIAESCGRISLKEKIHFIEIAYGSLLESLCQLQIAERVNYISIADIENIRPHIISVAQLLSGLRKSYINQLNSRDK